MSFGVVQGVLDECVVQRPERQQPGEPRGARHAGVEHMHELCWRVIVSDDTELMGAVEASWPLEPNRTRRDDSYSSTL